MLTTYIIPVLIFIGLGVLTGVLLTVASKVFYVKTDERIEQINEVLPQANCGACGFAGCADYANAIITKNAEANLCKPGGADVATKIGEITGKSVKLAEREVAVLHCSGDCNATKEKFMFDGHQSCSAAKRFYSGTGMCTFGCMGFGDCISQCDYGAISIKDGIAHINTCLRMGCGKCAKVCPNGLIEIRPESFYIDVLCSSKDNGKATKANCSNGCIGCKICEKKCLNDAIHVEDFHAVIDYTKCKSCGVCYDACPTGAIQNSKD